LRDVHDPAIDDHAGVEENAGIDGLVGGEHAGGTGRAQDEGHHLVTPAEAQRQAPVGKDEGHD